MKPRLQTSLGQQLVLTPQLRQALHLLQLSALELDAELAAAVESNPLLDWAEPEPLSSHESVDTAGEADGSEQAATEDLPPWTRGEEPWQQRLGPATDEDPGEAAERVVETDSLHDHLLWQLHLTHLSARDRRIGLALIDAIDDDGYLRDPLETIAESLRPELVAGADEVLAVLRQLQRFDPAGVAARDLGECLALQLAPLPEDTAGKALALRIASGPLQRLPKAGVDGLAAELHCDSDQVQLALQLLRTLDPRPGAQIGALPADTYITPDCVIWRQQGVWRVALAASHAPRLTIHRGYEGMIAGATAADAGYLRGRLQEARWLLKNLQARGETLLKVVRCLIRQQAGFLEFGDQALRPLTLREVAAEIGLHESTVSRAVARKYVRTPRGTMPLRAFFASGIDTEGGGEASSTAIQSMIRRLIDAENPRKPLSDARLAETLKATGVPVARRTVAKYREAMNIPSSHDRLRVG
ncbi:RNA polymerase factor sigma-54 [Cognatiluteimonas weifangensis]|uniref:RNA polymerase sigma-54 factor n=1 Tax=Cognatiluteimonas weifangensis TaxID=2303539 RepID=A0A372DSJ1_9GAMM|nr:RNA polymerase factor sigma-54 [Luteimonas weifangensis]RFP62434.1 RNA polymerase factor sigma-54 [Luteimonas weifangensis]